MKATMRAQLKKQQAKKELKAKIACHLHMEGNGIAEMHDGLCEHINSESFELVEQQARKCKLYGSQVHYLYLQN